jgi:hypothetical protein
MEYVSMLAGEAFGDSPRCTHPLLSGMARAVNDALDDMNRQRLTPFVGRLFGTNGAEVAAIDNLNLDLSVWVGKQVIDALPAGSARTSLLWVVRHAAAGNAEQAEEAVNIAINSHELGYDHLVTCFTSLAAQARSPRSTNAGTGVAAHGALAITRLTEDVSKRADVLINLLSGFLDEFDRLTGRTRNEVREVGTTELLTLMADALS